MPTEPLNIFGAGGHAQVVIDAVRAVEPRDLRLIDDNPELQGKVIDNVTVFGRWAFAGEVDFAYHIAVGNAVARRAIHIALREAGGQPESVIHPRACLAPTAQVGAGSLLAAGCIVAPSSQLGEAVIVNHNAVVDHDCKVGDFSHIAPGVVLGGGVLVGQEVLIGAGSTVLPGVRIGSNAIIGAGSTIVRDVAAGNKIVMTIARKI